MTKNKLSYFLTFVFIINTLLAGAQTSGDRFVTIENKLKELSVNNPGLNNKVELSVNGVAIQEFIRGIATANNLNMSIDANLTAKIVNNFTNVTVADVLIFLCRKYDLEMNFVGNIMSIKQYVAPAEPAAKYQPKQINVQYEKEGDLLTLDLNNDSLASVAKAITKATQKNVVFSPDLAGKTISGYIQKTPFNAAIEKLAFSNNIRVTPTEDNFYLLEKADAETQDASGKKDGKSKNKKGSASVPQGLTLEVTSDKLLNIEANDVPISEILSAVSAELKNNYFLFSVPKGNASLNIKNATYDEFLTKLFNNTEYTYKKEGEIYMIGERNSEGLRVTHIFQLKYRTVEKMTDYIPAELKKGVEVKTFNDQNSLILSGSLPRIQELEAFLRDVDRVVPVISIEVIIMDIRNNSAVQTGLKAGLAEDASMKTGGDIYPTVDMKLNSSSVNSVINGINGWGIVNLGKVTPNFYVTLKMLETNGSIKINSTPLLATLNGHEAKMNISETRYYFEQNSSIIATQSTTTATGITYKPLTADFALVINPIVSGDEQITLNISVKKQTFTEQTAGPNGQAGPYGTSSRDFQSLIRVKNQEMIMLGGLDEEIKDESASGIPVLSRIPVIKWLFSSRNKKKSKSKLTIFIKPTVIY